VSYEGAELPDVAKSGRKPGYYTFLLVGKDTTSGLTDTMMLVTYDIQGKKINAISLLRDTMVNTSGKSGGQKRLNVVYNRNRGDKKLSEKERIENGMTALKKEVSRLTGIYPDFYVMVEWEAIGRLVDAVDGVEFEVPFDMNYDDPYQDLHIHQKKGLRVLDGRDAMEVIRFRKNNDGSHSLGDVGRTEIQRDFLTAVLKKCLTPEILLKLPTLVDIFVDNVDTDLAVGNILAFAQLAIGMDVENGVKFVPMPCYGVSYGGASLVCVQEKELLALLNDGINPYLDEIKSSDLQLMYKKSGGGFGVTNGTLADPAVANPPAPKPAEPDEPDEPDEDPDATTDPGTTTDPGSSANPGATDPGTSTDPGASTNPGTDPGTTTSPGDIGTIDPGDIFPDPSPDIQGGEIEDTTQAAA
jgi:LCP family protein required for cell wall assembly